MLVLFCVAFANELIVVFVLGEVVFVVGSFVAVVGLFSAVAAVVAMRLSKNGFEKNGESSVLLVGWSCCWVLLLSGVNVVVLTLIYLRLVVCFIVVVITAVSVVSVVVVVTVFVDACLYLWWLLWPFSAAVVGCLWCLCRCLRL